MNIRLKRRLNTVFACGTVIVLALLVACDPPVQPQARIQEQLTKPNFQPRGTNISSTRTVTIFAQSGATIYYTTDGTDPTTTTSTDSGPTPKRVDFSSFEVGDTVTVKAIAAMEGFRASPIVTERFTIVERDVDMNDNGLIEIRDLNMLYNMRYNLEGTSYKTRESDTGSIVGAPENEPEACNDGDPATTITLCGYELTRDLDFANRYDYTFNIMQNDWRPSGGNPDTATNAGFPGIGAESGTDRGFTAIFNGNGHTIKNLYSRSNEGSRSVGLFRLLGTDGVIRNVGVIDAGVYGGSGRDDRVGVLVGYNNGGRIIVSHATGNANGGAGNSDRVGGLVGWNNGGTITASYATGNADGGDGDRDFVGGLLGQNENGVLTATFATGEVDGGDGTADRTGGLVGENKGAIRASYATGSAGGGRGDDDRVGGLVGVNTDSGTIIASYASGDPDGGSGTGDTVGTLAGENTGTVTDSYAFGSSSNGENPGHNGSDRPETSPGTPIHSASRLNAGNVGSSWNSANHGTAGAWNFGQTGTVTVPALAYADYDGPGEGYSCDDYPDTIPGTSTDLECGDSNATLVGGFRPIPDTPGVTISESTRSLTVGENAGTATYRIRLNTQPTQQVTVTPQITPGAGAVVTVDQLTLTFTPETDETGGWNMIQTVTVTGVDNNIDHPANQTATITHRVESADTLYRLTDVGSVTVTASDDDTARIVIDPPSPTTITEAVGTAHTVTYSIKLNTLPAGDVMVTPTATSAAISVTGTLTFGTSNWNSAQIVTITALEDANLVDETIMITHTVTSTADTIYHAITNGGDVTVTTQDNDIPVTISATAITAVEEGARGTYTVKLSNRPATGTTVIIDMATTSTDITIEPNNLWFARENWNIPQTVTVTAVVDDNFVNEMATITHSLGRDSGVTPDPAYYDPTFPIPSVVVTTQDNDIPVTISARTVTAIEEGTDGTYTVRLNIEPSGPVTITPTTDSRDFTIAPSTLTFNPGMNWSDAKQVTVMAAVDRDHLDETGTITHEVDATVGLYTEDLSISSVAVTIDDNDYPVTISRTAITAVEGGTDGSYTVRLNTEPRTGTVIVRVQKNRSE